MHLDTNVPGAIWSFVEPAVGLVCGSLPTMRVFLPRMPMQSLKNVVKPSYRSSKQTYTADGDEEWPRSYEMMPADNAQLIEPRTDNNILAERGEANKVDFPPSSLTVDRGSAINVQKEIFVT